MMQEKRKFRPVTSNDVCLIYELLHKKKLVSFPITKEGRNKIDAIVASINSFYFGRDIYSSFKLKATAYLYFIIKGHPFIDGNKRVAVLAFEIVCDLNNLEPNYRDFTLDVFAVFIEKTQEKNHQRVIQKLSNILFKTNGSSRKATGRLGFFWIAGRRASDK